MGWLWGQRGRRRSRFNNYGPRGLTCGQVTEHLFVGGELGPRDCEALGEAGVTVFINLQEEQQDTFQANEKVEGYLWLPAPDQLAPTVEQLALGVHFIAAAERENKKVFMHCKAGQGRAPLLCACYLVSLGATPLQAMEKVQAARPSTRLTPEQSARLREYAGMVEVRREADKIQADAALALSVEAAVSAAMAARDAVEPVEGVAPVETVETESIDETDSVDVEAGVDEGSEQPEMPAPETATEATADEAASAATNGMHPAAESAISPNGAAPVAASPTLPTT